MHHPWSTNTKWTYTQVFSNSITLLYHNSICPEIDQNSVFCYRLKVHRVYSTTCCINYNFAEKFVFCKLRAGPPFLFVCFSCSTLSFSLFYYTSINKVTVSTFWCLAVVVDLLLIVTGKFHRRLRPLATNLKANLSTKLWWQQLNRVEKKIKKIKKWEWHAQNKTFSSLVS